MQQSDEYTPNRALVSALTSVVQTLLAHVLALEPTQEAADALVAGLRRASRHVPRFAADDDQHASPVSPYEEEIEVWVARIVDKAVKQDAYAHGMPPRRGAHEPGTHRGLRERMATYTIQIPGGQLSNERQAALAEAVKDVHAKTTGAPRDFIRATVLEISSACFWLHGTPLECHQIFVHGFLASDAAHSSAPALCDAVAAAAASAAGFEQESVVVTISQVPADKAEPVS